MAKSWTSTCSNNTEGSSHHQKPEFESDVPTVDWEYMFAIPVYTWEDLAEERLWADYTRLHSLPEGTIAWAELLEQDYENKLCADVTCVDQDNVLLQNSSGEYSKWVELDVSDLTEDVEVFGIKRGVTGKHVRLGWGQEEAVVTANVTYTIDCHGLGKQPKEKPEVEHVTETVT